jgi:hypothetical protein
VIEEQVRGLREDVAEVRAMIGDRTQPDSVRGRLHQVEGLLRSAVFRRAPGSLLRKWERVLVVAAAVAAAVAPYVLYFAAH